MTEGLTYRTSGVDVAAGDEAVRRLGPHVASTARPEVIPSHGGFAGLFGAGFPGFDDPVLVSSTDGVGTKSKIAQLTGRHDTIGIDLVAMSVDDVAVQGAEPLFFLDYVSTASVDPVTIETIVAGVARGCRDAGCALIGGEISEHPGLIAPDEFDLVGFAVGVVERAALLPAGVGSGDALIGIASPGLRCNGYSLARRALLDEAGRSLDEPAWDGSSTSLADELLRPSVIYAPAMLALTRDVEVHGFAHITGGGLAANVARSLVADVDAVLRRGAWPEPRIFAEVQRAGDISRSEMEATFNLGIGMVAITTAATADAAIVSLDRSGHEAWLIGELVAGEGNAVLDG